MEVSFFILLLITYLIGSIPFAYLLTRFLGFGDIRDIGSGNVGATNVLRTGNKKLALSVLVLDILKGYIPVIILNYYFTFLISENIIYLIGSFAILGHVFPIWLKFKGGKGVATYIGYLLSLNYILGFIFIILWILIALYKKYSSLASIVTLVIIPLVAIFFSYDLSVNILLLVISAIIIIKHFANIKRLIEKKETKIKF